MKTIRFLRTMRPHGIGDELVVPDEVAAKAIAAGDAEDTGKPFPPSDVAPRVPVGKAMAPAPRGKRYFTRGGAPA